MRTTGCKTIRRADGRRQEGCWGRDGRFKLQRMSGAKRRPSSRSKSSGRGRRPANKGRVCERYKTVNTVHGRQRRCASYR
jgi:hypothetical protein